ncbi:hypothetical protein CDD83_5995 [Cordyceps sp. RAO-2017]|nr:hypothetical protein CDD83_5995 [Cordyceps sp. RAO-2017]
MSKEIPCPEGIPILGNTLQIDPEHPNQCLTRFNEIYGPIFKLRMPSERTFVCNYALARDVFDEKKFQKTVAGALDQLRNGIKDGLFTAYPGEHNWEIAHRILMPAFGPLSIRGMFGEMQDITTQLVLKLARFGPDHPINASDEFTKLTLDSIALCAMGSRFNSFYTEGQHPFVTAMTGMMSESFARDRRPPLIGSFYRESNKKYQADIEELSNTAKTLLEERRKHPSDKKDLLNAMINGKDPKTGEQLSDDTIIYNMITFLIAGHETTSGLLSFLFFELLQNPEVLRRAVEEVDSVIGKEPVTVDHLGQLPYIEACLRETLRLWPTAPGIGLEAKGDQVLNGEYQIKDKESIRILLYRLHRDPDVYGPDAEDFRPERMYEDNFAKLPPNCWKPFGNGSRACIGRPFAWQEALLATATLLQTFHFTKDSPSYQLQIRTAMTIKPKDFYMRAELRDPEMLDKLGHLGGQGASPDKARQQKKAKAKPQQSGDLTPLSILFGSNTGTCEALAQSLASAAPDHGFSPVVKTLDGAMKTLSEKEKKAVVIITASYEGQPPDNAAHFVEWLKGAPKEELSQAQYAVFGVGNHEWQATYQKIPIVVDEALAKGGATRLAPRAAADVTAGNIFDHFDDWQDKTLWPALSKSFGKSESEDSSGNGSAKELKLEMSTRARSSILRQDVMTAVVRETRLLTKPGGPRKRHLEIGLPSGVTYRAGDYLAVLPLNPPHNIHRVMNRFSLPWDAVITIDSSMPTSLPTDTPMTVHDVLAGMVEISQPVSWRIATSLGKTIPEEHLVKELKSRHDEIHETNATLLDLLEDYPTAAFTFGQFLAALPPMRVRQYSISSTPLLGQSECSLTYSVLDAPAKGSRKGHQFLGVASTFMERLMPGDYLQVSLRPSRNGFHLPPDDSRPLIMACAGTGLAPFHAFVAERAMKKSGGRKVGPALLFYGCHKPGEDDMYREEFDAWEKQGVVSVRRAFSGKPEASENCKHVQDRILHDKKVVVDLYGQGAQLYVCGAGNVGSGIEKAMAQIRAESQKCDLETAMKWIQEVKGERFWADVFA